MNHPLEPFLYLSPSLFALADPETGEFTWLSPSWTDALGWSVEEMLGRPFLDFVHLEDVSATIDATARLYAGDDVSNFQNRYRTEEGCWRRLRWYAGVKDGTIYAVAHDITDTSEIPALIEEDQRLLELVEEVAGLGHWRVDLETNQVSWSHQVFAMHGVDAAAGEPTLEEMLSFYHPEDRDAVEADVRAAVRSGKPFDFERRLMTRDGAVRWVQSRGRVRRNSHGVPVALFGVLLDITQQRLETQAQVDRVTGIATLAAGIAHEINNPLTSVLANLELIDETLDELHPDAKNPQLLRLRSLLESATRSADQVGKIVRDLRTFTRTRQAPPRTLDLNAVAQTALNMTRAELRKSAQIVTDLQPLTPILGDETELIQVLVNLLQNARHALTHHADGEIVVRTYQQKSESVVLEVQDNGPGIAGETQSRIFEPFFTTKPIGEGTGLGLYVSRNIIERHGGSLSVASAPGRTVFTLLLPCTMLDPYRQGEQPRSRILVLDDDQEVAQLIQNALKSRYHVEIVHDSTAALQRLSTDHFDALLTDISMPGPSGWDLLRELRRVQPALYASSMVVTGGNETAPMDLRGRPILEKPFSIKRLRALVEALIEGGSQGV